jgi:hypothetical protein
MKLVHYISFDRKIMELELLPLDYAVKARPGIAEGFARLSDTLFTRAQCTWKE